MEERWRQVWFDSAKAETWVREKTNRNDHPRIKEYNRFAHVPLNSPYCASGLYFTARKAGLDFEIKSPAAVRSWFADKSKVIYDHRQPGRFQATPRRMDVVWLYQSHIEAIADQSIPRDIEDDDIINTVAFNSRGTNVKEGVYHPMRRKWRDVKLVANHVTPWVKKKENQKTEAKPAAK